VAPAIGNVFAAVARVRHLPIRPEAVLKGLDRHGADGGVRHLMCAARERAQAGTPRAAQGAQASSARQISTRVISA
jgi:hypothetical protein